MLSLRYSDPQPLRRGRVEILGAFGSGKTTLARRLAGTAVDLLLEDHLSNPFWGQEHPLSVIGYLPYDLGFLIQHARLAAGEVVRPGPAICDWSFATDRLWASMRLASDFEAYDAAHRSISARLGPPLLYVHLDVPVVTIMERLARRGRPFEADFGRHVADAARQVRSLVAPLPPHAVTRVRDDDDADALFEALKVGGNQTVGDDERVRPHH